MSEEKKVDTAPKVVTMDEWNAAQSRFMEIAWPLLNQAIQTTADQMRKEEVYMDPSFIQNTVVGYLGSWIKEKVVPERRVQFFDMAVVSLSRILGIETFHDDDDVGDVKPPPETRH